jgi:O-antigen/teichoic acid export membrane protein
MKLGLKGLLRAISATLSRQLAAALFGLATTAVIARIYGPEGNGKLAIALLLPTLLATILNLGLSPANVYFLAARLTGIRSLMAVNLRVYCLIATLGVLIGVGLLRWRGSEYFNGVDMEILWIALAMFPLSLLNGQLISFFQGLQQFRAFNILAIIQPFTVFLMILCLVVSGNTELKYLVATQIIGQALVLSFVIRWLFPLMKTPGEGQMPSIKASQLLKYGYKAHLGNIISFINYKADVYLANYFLGPVQVGMYVIAVALAEKLWFLSQAVSTVLLPRLSELSADENKRKALTPLMSRWVLFASVCGGVILALIASSLIDVVFGAQYRDSVMPLYVLLPGIIVMSSSRVLANDIAARGRPEINMFISLINVGLNVLLNVVFIPYYGLVGAALATTISYMVDLLLRLFAYQLFTGIRWVELLLINKKDLFIIYNVVKKGDSPAMPARQ